MLTDVLGVLTDGHVDRLTARVDTDGRVNTWSCVLTDAKGVLTEARVNRRHTSVNRGACVNRQMRHTNRGAC